MKTKLLILLFLASLTTYAQYTTIPDVNFEKKLIALGIDSGATDGKVLTNSVNKLTSLDVSSSTIVDLTGIQDFVALKILNCSYNKLTSLNVSKNLALVTLYCHKNQFTTLNITLNIALQELYSYGNKINTLDVSNNINLKLLECYENQLTSLDVSKNTNLIVLNCYGNLLTTLDILKNTFLNRLDCGNNQLTTLDVSKNIALTEFKCQMNTINVLDISKNTSLTYLNCASNRLTFIDFSKNLSLTKLDCMLNKITSINISLNTALINLDLSSNQLTTLDLSKNITLQTLSCLNNKFRFLDLSKNTSLYYVNCIGNELKRLNFKNGNNTKATNKVDFRYNPDLSCIQVDDVSYSNTNWATKKDATASFSTGCVDMTAIPDPKFEDKLIALGIDTDGKNGKVPTVSIINITTLDVSNSMISDLEGIQDFYNLKSLNCSQNALTKIDLTKNSYLESLNISNNQLTILNVNYNILLQTIHCNDNLIKILDLSKNVKITEIYCPNNKLITLNLKNGNNSFNSGPSIKNFTNNPKLTCIQVDDITYSNTNWAFYKDPTASYSVDCDYSTLIPDPNFEDKLIALGIDTDGKNGKVLTANISYVTSLIVTGNLIADLTGIQDFTSLKDLVCDAERVNNGNFDGKITSLDISKNIELTDLRCAGQKLKTLDLSKNIALKNLNLFSNELSSIDVSNNIALESLSFRTNKLTNLDVSKNINLTWIGTEENKLTNLNVSKNTILKYLNCGYNQLSAIDVSNNPALEFLDCSNNALLTTLDVTNNKALIQLLCSGNSYTTSGGSGKLISLDLSKNAALEFLDFSANKIATIDLSSNTKLKTLRCYGNGLTSLDISKNTALMSLSCSTNKLTVLNVSKNTALTEFSCQTNQLTTIDVSSSIALTNFSCYSNLLTTLDVSKNSALTEFYCSSNQLSNLNLKNGKNTLLFNGKIDLRSNPNLSCILVDDINYSNTNWVDRKDATAFYSPYDCSSITQIPDAKFEDKLIALGIDTDGKNGFIKNTSIATITILDVSNSSITNPKGIEGFTALTTLNCSGNLLKKLDVSKNPALYTLNCSNNPSLICIQVADVAAATNWAITKDATASLSLDCTIYTLIPDAMFEDKLIALGIDRDGKNGKVVTESIASLTSLDVSSSSITDLTGIQDFVALTSLKCNNNQLTNLNVSKNVALSNLICYGNVLTSLNVSTNLSLTHLECDHNRLTALDVTANLLLNHLECDSNSLTTLDVSTNLNLTHLECDSNRLTALDVTTNLLLNHLECQGNSLTTLDVSKNVALTSLYCNSNKLTSLNLKNGKNTLLTTSSISFLSNPDLKCILVDDVAYSTTNWSSDKDSKATFNTDCTPYTLIPDSNFEDKLIALGIDTDGKNGKVKTSSVASLTSLEVYSSNIANLTGIEDFVSLNYLDCSDNVLTALNVTKNTALTYLDCRTNVITTLDVSKNTSLTDLYCNTNKLTTIDVSKNLVLNKLNASENTLTTLDVSKNIGLTEINCYKNSLTSLNLKNGNNINMKRMYFGNLAQNPNLICIQVDNAAFCNSNWEAKDATAGYSSDCSALANTYTTIPDAKFEDKLIALGIDKDGKNGKVLSASIFNVGTLDVSYSGITDLTGIQDFRMITSLTCGNNAITALDVSKNQSLDKLYCSVNKISNLDISKNTAITVLSCSFNLLTTLNVTANKSLKQLECSNNNLTYLNIQNGNNANMQNMMFGNFTNNPKLTCILVDNEAYSTANWGLAKDKIASYNTVCVPYTIIPDSNFENQLISIGIDTDGKNGKVKTSSISSQVDLDVRSSAIADMTGIQDFTALKRLNCSANLLTNLDVSKNIALTNLFCEKNQLSNLNVSLNTKLDYLVCYTNQITTLDVSKNTALTYLSCGANLLTTVDVSKNTILTSLYCDKNKLVKLNIKNGNNINITAFIATGNPTLTCIQVDDANYASSAMAFFKDATATYSATCSALGIEDSVFDKVAIFPNPTKGELHIDNIVLEKATVYDALGKLVKTTTFTSGANDNVIHLEGFASGIYFIYLESEGANTAKKIIVE